MLVFYYYASKYNKGNNDERGEYPIRVHPLIALLKRQPHLRPIRNRLQPKLGFQSVCYVPPYWPPHSDAIQTLFIKLC